jgi:type II secretory pathway pseudopilin PulG
MHTRRAFTLIESMVLLLIFAMISLVFFQAYATGTRLIIESKNRLGATALANQKMEIIRSLDYTAIGTTNGIPSGDLLEDEDVSVNTHRYHVHTFVQYVDDAFDGQAGETPGDAVPADYKRVRLSVSWGEGGSDQQVILFSNFSPNGIETSAGGGVLSINVLGSGGSGVPGASVHIVNAASGIDTTATTDASGNVTLPGAPAGVETYALSVSKEGYYSVATAPAYPASAYEPRDLPASVVESTLNQKSIVMDQAIDLTLKTEDPFGNTLSGAAYDIEGGRVLGTDPSSGESVYGYEKTGTFPSSGELSLADESFGQYFLDITDATHVFYKLSAESPAGADILDAPAGATGTVKLLLLDKALGSVFVKVTDSGTAAPVPGASVRLSRRLSAWTRRLRPISTATPTSRRRSQGLPMATIRSRCRRPGM